MNDFDRAKALQPTRGKAMAIARKHCTGPNVAFTALQTAEGGWLPVAELREDQGWAARRLAEKGIYPHEGPVNFQAWEIWTGRRQVPEREVPTERADHLLRAGRL